jgi:hypothetical protein
VISVMTEGERRIIGALRAEGFNAEVIRAQIEDGAMVVLFTIAGTSGRRSAMTATFRAPEDGRGAPKVQIREGFI